MPPRPTPDAESYTEGELPPLTKPAVWSRYLKEWTPWNHVRTITSVAASILFMVAIRGRMLV